MSAHWKSFLWAQLQKNIQKQGLSSCYMALALATPSVRTVVFRSFAGEHHRDSLGWTSDALVVTTDRRSRKCKELQHDRRYEVCWYMDGTGEQFRLKGSVAIYPPPQQDSSSSSMMPSVNPSNIAPTSPSQQSLGTQAFMAYRQSHGIDPHVFDWEAERRRHFGLLDDALRATFASSQPKPAALPITAVDPLTGWYVSPDHQAALDDAYTNFVILVMTVKEMDYVSLEGAHEIYTV
ncbi:pyridoxamine 5'-phosphate oxidase-domain-containing protein [Absidia repens]|uniref:Pyridoxamine 5'-phosphate oxidase-domain-containing protein n=1 Tax=Absidia repens TaxID=90262 RepID=A0A1X2HX68_9FUNG|nr:pyridoxamine 5'-phosphate oxidase-domain-containing protein [Absidia repens]